MGASKVVVDWATREPSRGALRAYAEGIAVAADAQLRALGDLSPDDGTRLEYLAHALIYEVRALRVEVALAAVPPEPITEVASEPTVLGWYDLELMGHRRRVGVVSEVEVAGRRFLEVRSWADEQKRGPCAACGHRFGHDDGDPCSSLVTTDEGSGPCGCPEFEHADDSLAAGALPALIEQYSPAAVFCMTPVTEERARDLAGRQTF